MDNLSKLQKALLLLLATTVAGTIGYALIEHQNLLNSLYMTIITLTTIGYGETFTLGTGGRIFTLFLVIAGVGTVAYTLASAVEFMIEGRMSRLMGRRKMRRDIEGMLGHYLLCGFGRVGQYIAADLASAKVKFLVIEKNPDVADKCIELGYTVIKSDATDDETLRAAGIDRARGLVSALSSDAENLYVTLTARELCPHLFIVSRCDTEESEPKLRRAGADRVISPHSIGGRRMAAMMLKPMVWDYLDLVTKGEYIEFNIENLEWRIDDIEVYPGSYLAGKSIEDAKIYSISGALILAVKKRGQPFNTRPPKDLLIEQGDYLIAIGTVDQLAQLEEKAKNR
ncbi:MAG: potassium channel family protein [Candidatus Geothermincolia bacterium]